jgi:DeoR/GlpR family transcriptional regulator of sugar metabolism
MQATYGFSSAWQQFKNQPVEDRTAQRAEAQQELAAAIQTVIRHGSPVFTVRKEGR